MENTKGLRLSGEGQLKLERGEGNDIEEEEYLGKGASGLVSRWVQASNLNSGGRSGKIKLEKETDRPLASTRRKPPANF